MRKIYPFLAVVLLLLTDCTDRERSPFIQIKEFPDNESISGNQIGDIVLQSGDNVNLVVIDSFLVIQRSEEPIFRIYNTNTYALLAEFGKKGRGPNEFIFPEMINQTAYDDANHSPVVCVYDYTRRIFTRINILNAINGLSQSSVFSELPIPRYNQYFSYFFYRDHNLLIATPESGARFVFYRDSTENFTTISYTPETEFSIDEKYKRMIYRSTSSINIEKGLMASAPLLLGELDFFDLHGAHKFSSIFSPQQNLYNDLNDPSKIPGHNPKYYIVQTHANNKFVYALNYDNYQNDFIQKDGHFSSQSILVFDWTGKPVKKYVLNRKHFIRSFAVDWLNNRFYGYCPEELENTIIVYPLESSI